MKIKGTDAGFVVGETVENIFDNTVMAVAETALGEAIKAFPIVNVLKGVHGAIVSYREQQRANLFLEFVQEIEQHHAGQVLKIFQGQNNIEMGGEILNALENSYLIIQSQMIARVVILYDVKQIDRKKFLKYAHIIPKLSSFLLEKISTCFRLHLERRNDEDYRIFNSDCDGAGQELTSYGFLNPIQTAGGGDFYQGTEELEFFYEYILNNKHND
ncbi:hypothetical protein [Acinetobacter calcoaceticus]|uniref:hypothetical protein n=1 Tax=Acinetobacter calcoaceticus TaxID=471 RepID=UPI0022759836|nr:hypothetical protein [Acinetobacter calcoaceticus]GLG82589.1 hypothetical protein ACSO1_11110 [Acinetobacter calcoaceticus]